MIRTFSLAAAIVFAALLSVQFARQALQPAVVYAPSVAPIVPAEPVQADTTSWAIEDLAAWPMAAGR